MLCVLLHCASSSWLAAAHEGTLPAVQTNGLLLRVLHYTTAAASNVGWNPPLAWSQEAVDVPCPCHMLVLLPVTLVL